MGLVDDRIEYAETNDKSAGYTVVEGDKDRDMVISNE